MLQHFFQFLLNIATTTSTTEAPTGIPTYAPVAQLYDRTTDYHWPKFSDNATKTDGSGKWSTSDGPFGFGNSVKLDQDTVSSFAKKPLMNHFYELIRMFGKSGGTEG